MTTLTQTSASVARNSHLSDCSFRAILSRSKVRSLRTETSGADGRIVRRAVSSRQSIGGLGHPSRRPGRPALPATGSHSPPFELTTAHDSHEGTKNEELRTKN